MTERSAYPDAALRGPSSRQPRRRPRLSRGAHRAVEDADIDRIVRMTAAEVDADLRAQGVDPVEVVARLHARWDAVLDACGAQAGEGEAP